MARLGRTEWHSTGLTWNEFTDYLKFSTRVFWHTIYEIVLDACSLFSIRRRKLRMVARAQRTTLAYGFRNISVILSACIDAVIALVTDINLNLRFDHSVMISSLVFIACHYVFGVSMIVWLQSHVVAALVPDVADNVKNLFNLILHSLGLLYITGTDSMKIMLIVRRHRARDFLLYDCARIQIDKSYQDSITFKLMVGSILLASFAEPTIYLMSIIKYHREQALVSSGFAFWLELFQFTLMPVIVWLCGCALMASVYAIPVMTAFMSCALAKRVDRAIVELILPFSRGLDRNICDRSCCRLAKHHHNMNQVELEANKDTLDTIFKDWPTRSSARKLSISAGPIRLRKNATYEQINSNASDITLHAMQYRNLIIMISEIHDIVQSFESLTHRMHVSAVWLTTIGLTQYIMLCIMRLRLDEQNNNSTDERSTVLSLMCVAAGLGLTMILNLIHFTLLSRLPESYMRMKQELFNMNLRMLPSSASRKGIRAHSANEVETRAEAERARHQASAIESAWNMYDVLCELCARSNLKFHGKMYYSKRLILTLVSQQISFCLVYAQFIDICFIMMGI